MLMFLGWALKVWEYSFDLLGYHVMAYFGIPRSMHAHSQYLSNLFSWCWIWLLGHRRRLRSLILYWRY